MESIDRIFPPTKGEEGGFATTSRPFCPAQDMVVETKPRAVWALDTDGIAWELTEGIPLSHTRVKSRRGFVRKATRQHSVHVDRILTTVGQDSIPDGVRLWHATEGARKLFLVTQHDLVDLFKAHQEGIGVACNESEETWTTTRLLETPNFTLGFGDGVSLLKERNPYVVRLCMEYAQMACTLYGLTMAEFSTLSQMAIMRHVRGMPIALHKTGGGYYDSGPILVVTLGNEYTSHDFCPTLMAQTNTCTRPMRVSVAEGVMTVIDGYARSNYAHGLTQPAEARTDKPFFSIWFYLDCMRSTRLVDRESKTQGFVMHTPVVAEHVVTFRTPQHAEEIGTRLEECPTQKLMRAMHNRLKTAESLSLRTSHRREALASL